MADPNPDVLDYVKFRFDRLDQRFDRFAEDVAELKHRVTALEIQFGQFLVTEMNHYASTSSRLDGVTTRLDRIERRLDLVETTP